MDVIIINNTYSIIISDYLWWVLYCNTYLFNTYSIIISDYLESKHFPIKLYRAHNW